MEKINFEFDYWDLLKKHMLDTYPNKIVFMYDSELSYFDKEELPLVKPLLVEFDSIDEFVEWQVDSWKEGGDKINILTDLSVLWINGVMDDKVIYQLRG